MTKQTAYQLGVDSGHETGIYGDFTPAELATKDSFLAACYEICDNKRQFADHPGYGFTRERNCDSLWDAFEQGETRGALLAWRERNRQG